MDTLTLTRPDDWHLHLRDGAQLRDTVASAALWFHRAIIMPNLVPPVTSTAQALAYRDRIERAIPEGADFQPLMTLYLTNQTTPDEIRKARASGQVYACKLYPAGATTNSDAGVTDIRRLDPVLEAMADEGMPLLIHGEVVDPDVDIFDRERIFIERVLAPLLERHTRLRVVLEHITTREAVEFVRQGEDRLAATLTAHHLLHNRNSMLVGGIRPHFYCLPILKRRTHQEALLEAATSGSPRFFLGTDSAPHPTSKKESACGCAGCYTAPAALPLYAQAFEQAGALDRLEAFAAFHGPDFYGLPRNTDTITLVRRPMTVPDSLPLGETRITPFAAGETLPWSLA
ncbi:dihydroorotase [Hahella sp. SMD15-11]|uniref:Dihydroorotase n=1 Tax=Thermohahella caldifontis TaxID=3142973 RepID=A0AB39UWY7_9GAMM